MKCIKCGHEMQQSSVGNYHCPLCGQTMDDLVYREAITLATGRKSTVAMTCCLCGAEKEYSYNEVKPCIYICDDCKKAIAWAKENMKEEK